MNAKELHRLIETVTPLEVSKHFGSENTVLEIHGISKSQFAEILVLAELKLVDDNLKATRNDVHNTSS